MYRLVKVFFVILLVSERLLILTLVLKKIPGKSTLHMKAPYPSFNHLNVYRILEKSSSRYEIQIKTIHLPVSIPTPIKKVHVCVTNSCSTDLCLHLYGCCYKVDCSGGSGYNEVWLQLKYGSFHCPSNVPFGCHVRHALLTLYNVVTVVEKTSVPRLFNLTWSCLGLLSWNALNICSVPLSCHS